MKLIWRFISPHWKLFALTVLLLVVDVAGSLLPLFPVSVPFLADMLVPRFPQEWDKTCEWLSMINH